MSEPKRLVDDPSVPDSLRRALSGAAVSAPAVDVGSGLARLERAIRMRRALIATGIAGGIVVAVILAWAVLRPPARPVVSSVSIPDAVVSVPAPEPPPVEAPTAAEPPAAPSEEVHGAPAARETPTPSRAAPPSRAVEAPPDPDREIALVATARRSLSSDPQAAIAALDEADRAAPHGIFLEERGGLRVLALAALGRQEEATRRGQAWLREHPAGTMAIRVRAAIAPHP